jgi:tetratricopeptide (TPR) repeat protein
MERREESVTFFEQAASICIELNNLYREGMVRNNLAITLIKLQRYDRARRELRRAIECSQSYGHAAQSWKTWKLLHDLEQATGNPQAAAQARQQAIQSYLAYRRDGGENQDLFADLCALVAEDIKQGDTTEAEQILAQYLGSDAEPWAKALIPKLQAILRGSRDPGAADDPALEFDDAAEVALLLERVGAFDTHAARGDESPR